MQISDQQIKMACRKFREISGITIYTPDEGTLDDFEQSRFDGLVAALEAALSAAEPSVGILQEAYKAGFLASTIGYNAELYDNFEKDPEWLGARYADISALTAQVQDVAKVSPSEYRRRHDAAIAAYEANTPSDYRYSAIALMKAVDAAFAAAAPAKQEG